MRVSLSWLSEYVDIHLDIEQLVAALTMTGLEVDQVANRYDYLKTVLVGQITESAPHANADRLKRCRVDTGEDVHEIVCGAPNAEAGLLAAVALPGTVLPNGITVQRTVIRGQASQGMLCSQAELGLGPDQSGILELDSSLPLGIDLAEALQLSDPVIDIDLTPNRPDCLSVIGIAREIAAVQRTALRKPAADIVDRSRQIDEWTSVTIESPELNPRYTARLIVDIHIGPSPAWLQDRLHSIGMRPINNIVDITNFVMLETGQPLHAFDFDRLADHRIVVRTATPGEPFTTLDGKTRRLDEDTLMICDGQKPVAIGGVMGGLNSEIENTSTRVLLESAYFTPVSIRKTAKKLGLNTEASHRFERGTDPEGTVYAVNRAAQMIADVCGGRLIAGLIDEYPRPVARDAISLRVEDTNRLLGTDMTRENVRMLLEAIQFEVTPINASALRVSPPSFRVDIHRPQDLMEEVARLSGYDRIPTTFPRMPAEGRRPLPMLRFRNRLKQLMAGLGFKETINYSFVPKDAVDRLGLNGDDDRRHTVALLNPLTEEQAVMRTTLIPGLLQTLYRNIAKQDKNIQVFEIGQTFFSEGAERLPQEREMLAAIWSGTAGTASWQEKDRDCDFYDIKGALEVLLDNLFIESVVFEPADPDAMDFFVVGRTAAIRIGHTSIGHVGEVKPSVLSQFGIKEAAFFFELDLERLHRHLPSGKSVQPLPKYPAAPRDVTLIIDKHIESARVQQVIDSLQEDWVEDVFLFDVYEGKPIPDGKKSLSYRIVYRSAERTLAEEEVSRLHQSITARLIDKFDASLPA